MFGAVDQRVVCMRFVAVKRDILGRDGPLQARPCEPGRKIDTVGSGVAEEAARGHVFRVRERNFGEPAIGAQRGDAVADSYEVDIRNERRFIRGAHDSGNGIDHNERVVFSFAGG